MFLFRHVDVSFAPSVNGDYRTHGKDNQEEATWLFVMLREVSNSPLAPYVRRLDIGFSSDEARSNSNSSSSSSESCDIYVKTLARLLPIYLARLPRLGCLAVHGLPSSISHDMKKLYSQTVTSVLHDISLPQLTELGIAFPLAYDFREFLGGPNPSPGTNVDEGSPAIPVRQVMGRLRHLQLLIGEHISDSEQQRYWSHPVSLESVAIPNRLDPAHLCQLAELAVNLDTLIITSTDMLNFDDNLNVGNFLHLKSLCLSGIAISSRILSSLIIQCQNSMKRVEFQRVELTSGTWQAVLMPMRTTPQLLVFVIVSCGYSATGKSSCYRSGLLPPPDVRDDIDTFNLLDRCALGSVQRHVNKNRLAAGFAQIPDYEYRHLRQPSAEPT